MEKEKNYGWLLIPKSIISLVANLAIIIGLSYSFIEYKEIESNNKVQNSINVLNRINDSKFIVSLTVLFAEGEDTNSDKYTDAKNYVLVTYYVIAVIYNSDIANNEIIGSAIKHDLKQYLESEAFEKVKNKEAKNKIENMFNSININ
jgi:hypothetical protein